MNTFETAALVGGGSHGEAEEMVIYMGEGLNGVYNRPYFDNTMKTNFTVQVNINIKHCLCFVRKDSEWQNITTKKLISEAISILHKHFPKSESSLLAVSFL